MADKTGISWTDHTASPWHGCEHAVYIDADGNEHEHPGCLNCYAEAMSKRNPGTLGEWGAQGKRVMSASFHQNCRRWNKNAEAQGKRFKVFPSICDPFEDWKGVIKNSAGQVMHYGKAWGVNQKYVGVNDIYIGKSVVGIEDLRTDLFATIHECRFLDFLLLTKRPQNIRPMWPGADVFDDDGPKKAFWPNAHLLTSISDQATTEALVPHLIESFDLCGTLGVSAEPLLGEIHLAPWLYSNYDRSACDNQFLSPLPGTRAADLFCAKLDWVIIGCESRGKNVGRLPGGSEKGYWEAAEKLIDQCNEAGVAVFHKQGPVNGKVSHNPSEWPKFARFQEWPLRMLEREAARA